MVVCSVVGAHVGCGALGGSCRVVLHSCFVGHIILSSCYGISISNHRFILHSSCHMRINRLPYIICTPLSITNRLLTLHQLICHTRLFDLPYIPHQNQSHRCTDRHRTDQPKCHHDPQCVQIFPRNSVK